MRAHIAALGVAGIFLLSGCTTARLTEPGQSADEQLLISTATDRAVAEIDPQLPPGTRVFLDPQYMEPNAATKYLVGSLRDQLLRLNLRLADDRASADIVAELRSAAQSVNHTNTLIGIPAIPVPIPLAGTLVTPKIAIYEKDKQTGVAKIALTAYDKNGKLTASTGAAYGLSKKDRWVVLVFISGSKSNLIPKSVKR